VNVKKRETENLEKANSTFRKNAMRRMGICSGCAWGTWRLALCAAVLLLVCGCATQRELDASRFLTDPALQDLTKAEEHQAADAPVRPVSALPSLTSEGAATSGEVLSKNETRSTVPITIQPDCLLQIRVEEDSSLDGTYPVNEIGAVQLGYIGPVILFNRTEEQAALKIAQILKNREFHHATVRVRILRASYDSIQVTGGVNRPGVIKIGAGDAISLNDALLRAGGLRPAARGAKVKIVRKGLTSAVALALPGEEYVLVAEGGEPAVPDVHLRNNDVAYVYSLSADVRGGDVTVGEKNILVLGEVPREGIYRFSGGEPCTIMHLIFKMGGLPPYANKKAVKILRRDDNGTEREIEIDVRDILRDGSPDADITLEHGDRVIVPERRLSLF